jgi:hypothetical protein
MPCPYGESMNRRLHQGMLTKIELLTHRLSEGRIK